MISLKTLKKDSGNALKDKIKMARLELSYRDTILVETLVLMNPYSGRYKVEDLDFKIEINNMKENIRLRFVPEFVNFCNKNTNLYNPHLRSINSFFY
jgi:hypothetical protein